MTVVGLAEDPRYDMARTFEAVSSVTLPDACRRIMERFGRQCGLPGFEIDSDLNGDELSIWTEAIAVYVTVKEPYFDPEEQANRVIAATPLPYRIAVYINTRLVSWKEERAIRAALAEAFECSLVPLPRKYFA